MLQEMIQKRWLTMVMFAMLISLVLNTMITRLFTYITIPYYGIIYLLAMVAGALFVGAIVIKSSLLRQQDLYIKGTLFIGFLLNLMFSAAFIIVGIESYLMVAHLLMAFGGLQFAISFLMTYTEIHHNKIPRRLLERIYMIPLILLMFEIGIFALIMFGHINAIDFEAAIYIISTSIYTLTLVDMLTKRIKVNVLISTGLLLASHGYLVMLPFDDYFLHIQALTMVFYGLLILNIDEIKQIQILFEEHNSSLYHQFNIYSQNLQKLIDKKTLQIQEANQEIINELEYAKVIQQSLLPPRNYSYRNTVFASDFYPCERLSGDFYDIFRIDEEYIALYYMDVAGHGISAALLTMLSNNFLRAGDHHLKRLWAQRPDKSLKVFYDHFNSLGLPDEMHLVIFYATYNLTSKILSYCSGGMNCLPIVFRKNGNYEFLEDSSGFPICKMESFYTPEYRSASIGLKPGDRVVFYTDGLTDTEKNGIFDDEALISFCRTNRKMGIKEFNALLQDRIEPHQNDLNDDITYIIMDV